MYKILAITNRKLCKVDFLEQISKIAKSNVEGIILREKDLVEKEYHQLASQVVAICDKYKKRCILHTYIDVALDMKIPNIHLSLAVAKEQSDRIGEFETLGISTHSIEEAIEAQRLGATYITAGHIFSTDCKKGVPPRGLTYLEEVCNAVSIPVYGIGGITMENAKEVINCGAEGICMMSSLMNGTVEIPDIYVSSLM